MSVYCIAGPSESTTVLCGLEGPPPFLVGGPRGGAIRKLPDDDS